jgi:NAD(P)-dependent dehydrogenase (short-subunit alcohol dehydrogenase family)
VVRLTTALAHLKKELGIRVNCICPGWVETPAVQRVLAKMSPEDQAALPVPPPQTLIQPGEIAEAVMMFVRADTLAGRVMVWPDGETWRLIPVDSRY